MDKRTTVTNGRGSSVVGRWGLAAGFVGLVLFPFLWGGFARSLPRMQEFFAGEGGYWLLFAAYIVVFQWTVFAVFLWCLRKDGRGLSSVGFPLRWSRRQAIFVALVGALLVAGAFLVASAPVERPPGVPVIVPEGLAERLVMILLLAPTAAIVEETIFRGFALTYLPGLLGGRVWAAVLVAGALFALMHGDWRAGGLEGAFNLGYRFAGALLFSALFLWRRSLRLPILVHWFFNAFSALTP